MVFTIAALVMVCPSLAVAGNGQTFDAKDGLAGALPAASARHMPSTATQYRALQADIEKSRPQVAKAQQESAQLKFQADALRQKLIDTAAQVQNLEREGLWLDHEIVRLEQLNRVLSADFVRKRTAVAGLIAVLQRMQHDMPPVLAFRAIGGELASACHERFEIFVVTGHAE